VKKIGVSVVVFILAAALALFGAVRKVGDYTVGYWLSIIFISLALGEVYAFLSRQKIFIGFGGGAIDPEDDKNFLRGLMAIVYMVLATGIFLVWYRKYFL